MEQITRQFSVRELRKANPRAKPADIALFADAFVAYSEATLNLARFGVIVAHPRTGQPMENPYLAIQATARNFLAKSHRIPKDETLWTQLDRLLAELPSDSTTATATPSPPSPI